MSQLLSNLHINRPLTDYLISLDPGKIGYVRDIAFPKKPVPKLSNTIRSIAREQVLRSYNGKVNAQGRVTRVDFATGPTDTYNCEVYAFEALLDTIEQENADEELQYQLQKQRAPIAAMNTWLERLAIETQLRDTTQFTQYDNVGGDTTRLWSSPAAGNSDPFADLLTGCKIVSSQAQQKANFMLMDHYVWGEIINHPKVQKLVNFWSNGSIITSEILEKMLGDWLEPGSLHIYRARYNAAAEGAAEAWTSFMHNDVFVGFKDQPGIETWGYGSRFQWNVLAGDDPAIVFEFPTYDAPLGGRVMRTVTAVDYHPHSANASKTGYLLTGVVDKTLSRFNNEL